MECGICHCAQAMWYVVDRLEPWEQFLFCTSWGHSQKCSTGSMVVAVKHSYLILGRDEGYSFLIDDIYASCLGCVTSVIKVIWKACCWCLLAADACWYYSADTLMLPRALVSSILEAASQTPYICLLLIKSCLPAIH